jgi:putative aminopeptidase FrvX
LERLKSFPNFVENYLMFNDYDLLKEVLSVPTTTFREEKMIEFIIDWLDKNQIEYYLDSHDNVYATKGNTDDLPSNFYFPCVISHTDTVHQLDTINIREEQLPNAQKVNKLSLKAYNNYGKPTGIGGDDKCGVFACLKLLKELPYLKAAFFVSEEIGCIGSKNSDDAFFENVGYAIQFDAPENWMVTEKCFGEVLFDRGSEFFQKCDQVLTESMDRNLMRYMVHPYTDVYALKQKYDFSCINFSIGYYDYHTRNEYVVVEDVYNGIEMGRKMIESLGYNFYIKSTTIQQTQIF